MLTIAGCLDRIWINLDCFNTPKLLYFALNAELSFVSQPTSASLELPMGKLAGYLFRCEGVRSCVVDILESEFDVVAEKILEKLENTGVKVVHSSREDPCRTTASLNIVFRG